LPRWPPRVPIGKKRLKAMANWLKEKKWPSMAGSAPPSDEPSVSPAHCHTTSAPWSGERPDDQGHRAVGQHRISTCRLALHPQQPGGPAAVNRSIGRLEAIRARA
jgi:hypothetical protein